MTKDRIETIRLDAVTDAFVRETRARTGNTVAHDVDHLANVAALTELFAIAANYSPRETLLVRIPGRTHDLFRSKSESNKSRDEELSAMHTLSWMRKANRLGIFSNTHQERVAVGHAIRNHSEPPNWFTGKSINFQNLSLSRKMQGALFGADKGDANGPQIGPRRSQFVGGARLHEPEGDLRDYGFKPGEDNRRVVLTESFIRQGFVNPEDIYPPEFAGIVKPLYIDQRLFVNGLMKAEKLTVADIASDLLTRKNGKGENLLQTRRKIVVPSSIEELVDILVKRTGISDQTIAEASDDQSASAAELTNYFVANYKVKLLTAAEQWQPRGELAQRLRKDVMAWNDGSWFEHKREELLQNTAA